MRSVVVYESMYGNTRQLAEAIVHGINEVSPDARLLHVAAADAAAIDDADLVVVGGPTHVFGMTRPKTRAQAVRDAAADSDRLHVEPAAVDAQGVREWLDSVPLEGYRVAAFDTHVRMPGAPHAAGKIERALRRLGCSVIAPTASFLVTKDNVLVPGEIDRAYEWGRSLARAVQNLGAVH